MQPRMSSSDSPSSRPTVTDSASFSSASSRSGAPSPTAGAPSTRRSNESTELPCVAPHPISTPIGRQRSSSGTPRRCGYPSARWTPDCCVSPPSELTATIQRPSGCGARSFETPRVECMSGRRFEARSAGPSGRITATRPGHTSWRPEACECSPSAGGSSICSATCRRGQRRRRCSRALTEDHANAGLVPDRDAE